MWQAPSKPITADLLRNPFRIFIEDASSRVQWNSQAKLNLVQDSSMSQNELQEKHLQEALIKNAEIPVPDVIEIDEEVYDKMYPKNVIQPKSLIFTIPEISKTVEYDIDSQDRQWINDHNISVDDFEKAIEILEEVLLKQTPTLDDLKNLRFLTDENAESIFDYWLDKCLSEKSRLTFQMKAEKKQRWFKSIADPYVAFRKSQDKMNTRKNRAKDHANYMTMLEYRRQLSSVVDYYKKNYLHDQERRKFLQGQLEVFKDQYHKKSFNIEFLSNKMSSSQEATVNKEEVKDSFKEKTFEATEEDYSFSFERRANCEYHQPLNDFAEHQDSIDTQKRFYITPKGFIRQRIGRGGRVIYDRRILQGNREELEQEFVQLQLNTIEIRCRRHRQSVAREKFIAGTGTSSFSLQNSTKAVPIANIPFTFYH